MATNGQRYERAVALNKLIAVIAILGTLAACASLSYSFGEGRAQRIACIHNQEVMQDAINAYEADNAGIPPARIWRVRRYYTDPPENFGRCPSEIESAYSYDPETGLISCPNPEHRPR